MQSAAEVIRQIEEHFDPGTLDLQILYLRTIADAYPKRTHERRELALLLEARRLMGLLIKQDANRLLGADSPYFGDPELLGRDYWQDYESFQQYRVMTPPRATRKQKPGLSAVASAKAEAQARASVQQRTLALRATQYRNNLTRRSEGGEAREEHKQSPLAQLLNTPKMRDLLKRIQTAIAEQEPRRERRGSPPMAATTSAEAACEPDTPSAARPGSPQARDETAPALSAPAAETPSGDELHVAAESPRPPACRPGLLFAGHCGSTQWSAAVSAAWRTGGPRSSVSAGPGGACFRAAA
jgi:hypothetical protein